MKKPTAFRSFVTCLVASAALFGCSGESIESSGGASAEALTMPLSPDAGLDPVEAGAFSCGTLSCDSATQYCRQIFGGPFKPDGPSGSFTCVPAPVACAGEVTCACVHGPTLPKGPQVGSRIAGMNQCHESNGAVTVTILAP